MTIVEKHISELKEYENNPRHNEAAVHAVAESIKQFGFKVPIVIDKDGVIVAGHTRLKASKLLNIETVPCIIADDLTPEKIKAFRVADNKTAELAEWDFEKLETELADIAQIGFAMDDFGFEPFEDEQTEIIEDEPPEVEEDAEPVTQLGDIWKLGMHRLMCGSSTDKKDTKTLMNGEKAKILFTSPPYADLRDYEGGKDISINNISSFIRAYRDYTDYQCVNLGIIIREREIVQYWNDYIDAAKDVGYKLMSWNVWDKTIVGSIGQQKHFFPTRHEWVFIFGTEYFDTNEIWDKKEESINEGKIRSVRQKDGSTKLTSTGDMTNTKKKMESVLSLCSELGKIRSEHPAVFPVGLPAEYIKSMTNENDIVIEPFCGSGTTLIACEQTNRICYGMELEPKYCDVIIKRWETLTGEKAVKL